MRLPKGQEWPIFHIGSRRTDHLTWQALDAHNPFRIHQNVYLDCSNCCRFKLAHPLYNPHFNPQG